MVAVVAVGILALLDLRMLLSPRTERGILEFDLPMVEWLPKEDRTVLFPVKVRGDGSLHFPSSSSPAAQDLVSAISNHPWGPYSRSIEFEVAPDAPYGAVLQVLRASAATDADVVIDNGDDDVLLRPVESQR